MNTRQFDSARRSFLAASALGLSGAAFATIAGESLAQDAKQPEPKPDPAKPKFDLSAVKRGTLLGCGNQVNVDTGEKRFVLSIVDLDAEALTPRVVVTGFLGHGFAPDPRDPYKVVIFEKHGPGCVEIDLAKGEVTRKLTAVKGAQFYGHGAFSPDGATLYATESVIEENYRGIIAIRDGTTFELKGEFPTFGAAPHDCQLIDGGKVMAITNGGGKLDGAKPCVTYVDVEKKTLIEKIEFESEKLNAGHLLIGKKGDLAVAHARRDGLPEDALGAVSVRPKGGKFKTLTTPEETWKKMVGETLSLAFNEETRVVAATNPYGNVVTFWDMDSGELKKEYAKSKNPRGIVLTLDNAFFVLSYGKEQPAVGLVDAKTLNPVPGSKFDNAPISGSHMFMHAMPPVA